MRSTSSAGGAATAAAGCRPAGMAGSGATAATARAATASAAARTASLDARPRATAPCSLLWRSPGADSLSATGPPSSAMAATASSGPTARRPSTTESPALPQERLGLVLREPAVSVVAVGDARRRAHLRDPLRVRRRRGQRLHAAQRRGEAGERRHPLVDHARGDAVVEQLGQRRGERHRHRAERRARADRVDDARPGLVHVATHAHRVVEEHQHPVDRRVLGERQDQRAQRLLVVPEQRGVVERVGRGGRLRQRLLQPRHRRGRRTPAARGPARPRGRRPPRSRRPSRS